MLTKILMTEYDYVENEGLRAQSEVVKSKAVMNFKTFPVRSERLFYPDQLPTYSKSRSSVWNTKRKGLLS